MKVLAIDGPLPGIYTAHISRIDQPMTHDTDTGTQGAPSPPAPSPVRRYEPPRVIPAGNLRDLVAEGGSGILRMQGIERLEERSHTRR